MKKKENEKYIKIYENRYENNTKKIMFQKLGKKYKNM